MIYGIDYENKVYLQMKELSASAHPVLSYQMRTQGQARASLNGIGLPVLLCASGLGLGKVADHKAMLPAVAEIAE